MDPGERRRSNLDLYKIYKQPDIVKFVKLQRLNWAGHLSRMNEDRCCKKFSLAKSMGNRPRDKPPLRWIDCFEKDLRILKVKNWKTSVKSRDVWRRPGPTQGGRVIEEECFENRSEMFFFLPKNYI
ncbi:uncharacterized transposon-derived protein F52C9.6 [Trichonephila clavipes]|nr:uncharacterized transposon-derived protein F52C9.6 [Trichonephila clavipes]